MEHDPIYLDHSRATPLSPRAWAKMQPFLRRHTLDPSAPYMGEREPLTSLNSSITQMRDLLGVEQAGGDLLVTSSGAEAIAQLYQTVCVDRMVTGGRNHLLTAPTESAPLLIGLKRWEVLGHRLELLSLDPAGRVLPDVLQERLSPRTALVSLSYAHGLTGVIQPIEELLDVLDEEQALLHLDLSHALGKMPLDLAGLLGKGVVLTFDGALLHAPRCSGALLTPPSFELAPLIPDAHLKRGGAVDLPALIGLSVALQERLDEQSRLCLELAMCKSRFEQNILQELPDSHLLCGDTARLPHVSAFVFEGVSSELLAFHLAHKGVHASFGGGREQKLENIIASLGLPSHWGECGLSFSLSYRTTEEELERATGLIIETVRLCRTFSAQLQAPQEQTDD